MNVVSGDILNYRFGIVAQQVNCQMVMGSGLAASIRNIYPRVFTQYKNVMGKVPIGKRLGKAQIVEVLTNTLYIANLFGQFNYLPRTVCHTDYSALAIAMRQMRQWRDNAKGKNFPIYLPYKIGCGLAGGDWDVVQGIIRDVLPDAVIVRKTEAFK